MIVGTSRELAPTLRAPSLRRARRPARCPQRGAPLSAAAPREPPVAAPGRAYCSMTSRTSTAPPIAAAGTFAATSIAACRSSASKKK